MRWLCVKSEHRDPLGEEVIAGRIYTECFHTQCWFCKTEFLGFEEVPLLPEERMLPWPLTCPECKRRTLPRPPVPGWNKRNFVPWNPDETGATEEEANQLYELEKESA